jgi:hypothetical protein
MNLSKTRVLTSVGFVGLLVACGASACSSKSDAGASSTGGSGTGGESASGNGGQSASGAGGEPGADNAGASEGGAGGSGTSGGSAGSGGSADSGGTAGSGGSCNANLQTDPANCGSCGHSCGTADCSDGLCYAEPVLVPDPTVDELTESGYNHRTFFDAGNLYAWEKVDDAAQNPDLRYRLLRAPAAPATLPTAGSIVQDIPDDGSAPYFVDAVNFDATYLYQCTTTGGTRVALNSNAAAPTVIFKAPVANIDCNDIAIGTTALFISSHDIVAGKDTLYTIPIASLGPNAVPTLVPNIGVRDNDIFSLTVVGSDLYWIENDLSLAATPPNLVTAPTAGLAAGGKPTKIDADLGSESASIASDGSYLYWTDTHGAIGEVRRTKLPYVVGATPEALLQDLDGVNPGIIMDANYLYVMEENNPIGNVVYRVAKDGSTSDALGIAFVHDSAQHKALQMTGVDASYVYFLLFDGIIGRLPNKP